MSDVTTCEIVDPAAGEGRDPVAEVGPLGGLRGRRIAVLDVTKVRSEAFAARLARALEAEGAEVERGIVLPAQRASDAELAELGRRCDGAVLALADCGTCTSWTMFDAIELHRHGCRAVMVTTSALLPTVAALAGRLGMAGLPVVEVSRPNRDQTVEEIDRTATLVAPAVAAALAG